MDIDELPWDEDTSMMHPRAILNEQIVPATPLCPEMYNLVRQPAWRSWMNHWAHWDVEDQTYVGSCPDNDEICREKDPTIFLLLFKEASVEWTETNHD